MDGGAGGGAKVVGGGGGDPGYSAARSVSDGGGIAKARGTRLLDWGWAA